MNYRVEKHVPGGRVEIADCDISLGYVTVGVVRLPAYGHRGKQWLITGLDIETDPPTLTAELVDAVWGALT